jgi:hypothetical protein
MTVKFLRAFLAIALIAAGVGLWAPSPGASNQNFVITNDNLIQGNNTGTVWQLENPASPELVSKATLMTGGLNNYIGGAGMNEVATARHGTDVCVFISDDESGSIASFVVPGYAEVGLFKLPGIVNSNSGLGLAARGQFLFANYVDNTTEIAYIATWKIGSGCVLTLVNTYLPPGQVWGMAATPDGKTLVVSYSVPVGSVDSFSIGADGSLLEHGPYDYFYLYAEATGVDITADGKYAIMAEFSYGSPPNYKSYTEIGIYPINSDGSLGEDIDFGANGSLGPGVYSTWIRLSPNEKFLYVSSNSDVTTLSFDESAPSVALSCNARMSTGVTGLTTIMPTAAGGFLAVTGSLPSVGGSLGLYKINPANGCLAQTPNSPINLGSNSIAASVAPWPPRPF